MTATDAQPPPAVTTDLPPWHATGISQVRPAFVGYSRGAARVARVFLTAIAMSLGLVAAALSGYDEHRALAAGSLAIVFAVVALAIRTDRSLTRKDNSR